MTQKLCGKYVKCTLKKKISLNLYAHPQIFFKFLPEGTDTAAQLAPSLDVASHVN